MYSKFDFNLKEYELIFKALGNKRRLQIVTYLTTEKEATVGTIASKIKLSIKATSKHLIILSRAGILEKDQRSLLVWYRMSTPVPKHLSFLASLISNSRE